MVLGIFMFVNVMSLLMSVMSPFPVYNITLTTSQVQGLPNRLPGRPGQPRFTVNKQKSVYKGYISIYVPSFDIMCTIISHTGVSVL